MREILFRGKRKDNGEWIEGYIVKLGKESFSDPERYGICNKAIPIGGSAVCYNLKIDEVIPETVGQFTGLTDKNDNKIFEGDIVKVKITQAEDKQTYGDCEYKIGVIVYSEDFALFTCKNNFMNFINWAFNDYEVIGNIHDNPGLLKRGKK